MSNALKLTPGVFVYTELSQSAQLPPEDMEMRQSQELEIIKKAKAVIYLMLLL
jgi:hypothetical protein